MAGVGMIIPQSDQDLILGLSLPVMGRMTGPLVPRMTEVPLVPRMAEGLLAPRTMEGPLVPRTTEGPLMPRTMEGLLVPRTTEGPLVSRTREGPPVPRRMAEVQLMRRIWCLADLQAPGVMIAVLQGLVHGHTGMNFQILIVLLLFQNAVILNMIHNFLLRTLKQLEFWNLFGNNVSEVSIMLL